MSKDIVNPAEILIRAVYKHFTNELVQVVKVVQHARSGENLVLYSFINNPNIWHVIPIEEFHEEIQTEGGLIPLFSLTDIKIGSIGGIYSLH